MDSAAAAASCPGLQSHKLALVEEVAAQTSSLPQKFIHTDVDHGPPAPPLDAQVPIVDLSGLHDERRAETLSEIRQACLEWGVFLALNSGLSQVLCTKMKEELENFLALPIEERAPSGLIDGFHKQGYGSGHVQAGGDGSTDWRDFMILMTYPESIRDYNVWPTSSAFREVITNWSKESKLLSEELLACFSETLGLPSSYIQETLGDLHQMVIFNIYPACPQPNLTIGASKHTDPGGVTILWQPDDVEGLQVLKDGAWVTVRQPPGTCIVIVGDQLEIISNGAYKSVEHRAVTNASQRRTSLVVFYNLDLETVVAPAPQLVDAHHRPNYKPTRFLDHVSRYN